jgi:hypothetical protein
MVAETRTNDCKNPAFGRRSASGRRGAIERTLTRIGFASRHHGRTVLGPRELRGLRKCVAAIGAIEVCRL